jgi:surface antigen
MKKITSIVLALALSTAIVGCTTTEQGAVGGAVAGALVGQAIGGNTESTLIGAAVGTVAGAFVGKSLERRGYCRYRNSRGVIYEAPCPQ